MYRFIISLRAIVFFVLLVAATVSCGPSGAEQSETVEAEVALAARSTVAALPTVTDAPTLTAYPTWTPKHTYTPLATYTALPTYTPRPTLTPNPTHTALPTDTPTSTPGSAPVSTPAPVTDAFNVEAIERIIDYMFIINDIFLGDWVIAPWGEVISADPTVHCDELLATWDYYRASIPPSPAGSGALQAYEVFLTGIAIFEEPVFPWIEGCRADPTPRRPDAPFRGRLYTAIEEAVTYFKQAERMLEEV